MTEVRVTVSVVNGVEIVKSTHRVTRGVSAADTPRVIRELVRQAAESVARAFPEPKSKYSDDLFKVSHQGNISNVVADAKDIDAAYDFEDDKDSV